MVGCLLGGGQNGVCGCATSRRTSSSARQSPGSTMASPPSARRATRPRPTHERSRGRASEGHFGIESFGGCRLVLRTLQNSNARLPGPCHVTQNKSPSPLPFPLRPPSRAPPPPLPRQALQRVVQDMTTKPGTQEKGVNLAIQLTSCLRNLSGRSPPWLAHAKATWWSRSEFYRQSCYFSSNPSLGSAPSQLSGGGGYMISGSGTFFTSVHPFQISQPNCSCVPSEQV